jgi:hypothetical protein
MRVHGIQFFSPWFKPLKFLRVFILIILIFFIQKIIMSIKKDIFYIKEEEMHE